MSYSNIGLSSFSVYVYPKVKVGTEGQRDKQGICDCNRSSLLSLKDVPLLLLQDSCFPVRNYRDISPLHVAKVPKSYVPKAIPPTRILLRAESPSKESDKESNSNEGRPAIRSVKKSRSDEDRTDSTSDGKSSSSDGDRPKLRASSAPRPRAVLSSPDNDAVIGNKNSIRATRPSALKNHNTVQSRHSHCKTVGDQAVDYKSPVSLRKPKDTTNVDFRVKKVSATSMQRRSVTPSRLSSVRI